MMPILVNSDDARSGRKAKVRYGRHRSHNRWVNKTAQIVHLQGRNSSIAIQEMLTGYSSTPHPATEVAPYEALINRKVRSSYAIKRGRVTRMLVIQPLLRGMTAQTGC